MCAYHRPRQIHHTPPEITRRIRVGEGGLAEIDDRTQVKNGDVDADRGGPDRPGGSRSALLWH